jgi:YidC/Oxa1 family membrane protein insertase
MEKRAIIAAVLSIAFFYAYYLIFPPPKKEIPKQPVNQVSAVLPFKSQTASAGKQITSQPPEQKVSAEEKDIKVDTDLYTAVFSSKGGSIKNFILKKYKETNTINGKQVALVNETDPAEYALQTSADGLILEPLATYSYSADGLTINKGEKRQLDFVYTSPNGYIVKKTYIFRGGGYEIDLLTQITNNGNEKIAGNLDLIFPYLVEDKTKESRFEISGPVTCVDKKLNADTLKKIEAGAKNYENVEWTGFADKYFLSAVLAEKSNISSVRIVKGRNSYINSTIKSNAFEIEPGQAFTSSYKLFFGPKELDILKAQGGDLEKALDLGWFSAIAKPLLHILTFFYKYTHNYGVAIIIITVILKILFFPLTHKSYKSMKEMQKLQPKMLELREKFKNDREALNRATMELYKTHKVNPLGGCLPMVVQIPVFFALYKSLMFSIELRHAPFILWITDLSAKDPYYVTPIIMGATMFIQQKMTPSTMDPTQAKMMLAMPIVFTFMFLNFPSGLVIYWLVNNILTIAQQAYINSRLKE